jgi:hypothetical protein
MIVQIANNATAPDLSALGVQSLARDGGYRPDTWFSHSVKAIAIASYQKEYQEIVGQDLSPARFKAELTKLVNLAQRALTVLNPENGPRFRLMVLNVKNLPPSVAGRISVYKLQRFINNLTLTSSSGVGSSISPLVVVVALKAFLLMHGFSTANNSKVPLPSMDALVEVGFLPRIGAQPYAALYEDSALQFMALGYGWRWKVGLT